MVTVSPSGQPGACSVDQDCRTLNARCYPGLSSDAVGPQQIPLNNSLYCYCNLMFYWIGSECSQLSWQSIVMGVSNLVICFSALVLAVAMVIDMMRFTRYSSLVRQHIRSPRTRTSKPSATRCPNCCYGSEERNRMDMYMVTSILLFIAFLSFLAWMLTDTIQIWMMETCVAADGVRHNCLLVVYGIFRTIAPIFFLSLMLLLSALMYNASYKANGLSYLPCASIWTLLFLDAALCALLIAASSMDNITITSYAGAFFVLLACVINLMICYRLRDFSFIKLLVGRNPKDRPEWTIKQRLMVIGLTICVLDLLFAICLILRGAFTASRSANSVLIADYIVRWAYLGILVVYFSLIHYNSKQRVRVMLRNRAARSPRGTDGMSKATPKPDQSEFQSSQPSISRI